ncbi:hypothetical protein EDD17DRAFT_1668786 [Pisolithus thermaeus]|nr:hypothetical protein EDD17DRAFT_1668786 [Pisolithus thermaeus]
MPRGIDLISTRVLSWILVALYSRSLKIVATVVGLVARTKDKISLTCFLCHPPALFGRIANCSSGSSARLISSALLSCYDSSVIPGQLGKRP